MIAGEKGGGEKKCTDARGRKGGAQGEGFREQGVQKARPAARKAITPPFRVKKDHHRSSRRNGKGEKGQRPLRNGKLVPKKKKPPPPPLACPPPPWPTRLPGEMCPPNVIGARESLRSL